MKGLLTRISVLDIYGDEEVLLFQKDFQRVMMGIYEEMEFGIMKSTRYERDQMVGEPFFLFGSKEELETMIRYGDYRNGIDVGKDEGIIKFYLHGKFCNGKEKNDWFMNETVNELVFLSRIEGKQVMSCIDEINQFCDGNIQELLRKIFVFKKRKG